MTFTANPPRMPDELEIRRTLADDPARAFDLLTTMPCAKTRRNLGSLIAQNWSRIDINKAWNAIARSSLNTAERQMLLNELWS